MIDLEWIREVIEMVDESGIDALEVSRFGTRVKVQKSPTVQQIAPPAGSAGGGVPPAGGGSAGGAPAGGGSAASDRQVEAESTGAPADSDEEAESDLDEITSPMVGTFYRAPAPDAPPYVEVGDRVQKGQTLCILEAMKLMNELESELTGVVREICVQNAEPVEYGQLLFRVESDGGPGD